MVAPFDWETDWLPRDPVPVDAIFDIGENQRAVNDLATKAHEKPQKRGV